MTKYVAITGEPPPPLIPLAAMLLVLALLPTSCIESKCYRNADCPEGEVCLKESGRCVTGECSVTGDCPPGSYCKGSRCVQGCLVDDECAAGEKCIEAVCVLYSRECNCPLAPPLCVPDINPNSPTFGQTLCAADYEVGGLVLFVGSIMCSHCWNNFKAAMQMKAGLEDDGFSPALFFVHLATKESSPELVQEKMSWATDPVVADTEQLDIWERYAADWYHLVFVAPNGCLAGHIGPVVPEYFSGTSGQEIRELWISSFDGNCVQGTPEGRIEGGADVVVVEADDVAETVDSVVETVDAVPDVPDVSEVLSDLPGDGGELTDESSEDWDSPGEVPDADIFQPAAMCQVVATEPVEVGDQVPYFLCTDVNAESDSVGSTFSPYTLKEQVWIAYFGSCS